MGDKVTIAKAGVDLEPEEDKECGEGELYRTSMRAPDVRDCIAKADKLIKQKVIAASFGRIV